jgi:hypothetical protein
VDNRELWITPAGAAILLSTARKAARPADGRARWGNSGNQEADEALALLDDEPPPDDEVLDDELPDDDPPDELSEDVDEEVEDESDLVESDFLVESLPFVLGFSALTPPERESLR